MKKTMLAFVITLFSASVCLSTQSYADGRDGGGPQDQQQWHRQGGQDRGDHRDQGGPGRQDGHGDRGPRGGPRGGERDHFAWQGHDFRRGHPAPPRFRGDEYRVHDWRGHGLREPSRGEYWAYVDGNYVLIAVATGVITSIILDSMVHQ